MLASPTAIRMSGPNSDPTPNPQIARPLQCGLYCILRFRVFALQMLLLPHSVVAKLSSTRKKSTEHWGFGAEDCSGEAFPEGLWFL